MKRMFSFFFFMNLALLSHSQWFQQQNIPTSNHLNCIMFADSLHGWIAGNNGEILRTLDGGGNWELISTGTPANLSEIFFPDSLHGWALWELEDYTCQVISSNDGGVNWHLQYTNDHTLSDVFFTDSLNGWVTAWYNKLLHTEDGGANWEVIPFPGMAMPNSVQFCDSGIGFLGGTDYNSGFNLEIYKTIDGGDTWEEVHRWTSDWHLYRLFFIDEMNGWLTGHYDIQGIHLHDTSGNVICYTKNGGYGWATGFDKENQNINSLFFTSPLNGWAVANEGKFFSSMDGGDSWQEQSIPPYENLKDITFSSSQTGWAVGNNGTVMRTDNNGALGINHYSINEEKLNIYPNPANDKVSIAFQFPHTGEVFLYLYNIYGELVKISSPGIGSGYGQSMIFDMNSLPPGIYICELKIGDKVQGVAGKLLVR